MKRTDELVEALARRVDVMQERMGMGAYKLGARVLKALSLFSPPIHSQERPAMRASERAALRATSEPQAWGRVGPIKKRPPAPHPLPPATLPAASARSAPPATSVMEEVASQ